MSDIIDKKIDNIQVGALDKVYKIKKAYLPKKTIRKIYDYFTDNSNTLINDNTALIPIKKEFFSKESVYDRFVSRYESRLSNDKNHFNSLISNYLINIFMDIAKSQRFQPLGTENQENDENEIENVYTVREYIEKINNSPNLICSDKQMEILKKYDEYNYITDNNIDFNNIIVLNNKDPNHQIVSNPLVQQSVFDSVEGILDLNTNKSMLMKVKLHIKRKISANNIIFTKYKYQCPRCERAVILSPHVLSGNAVGCDECGPINEQTGIRARIPIDKKKYTLHRGLNCYIYEAKINPTDNDSVFIFSKDNGMENSVYELELLLDHIRFEFNDTKARTVLYVLSRKEVKPEVEDGKEFIVEGSGIPFEKKHNLPRMKLFDIRQSVVDMYKNHAGEEINHEGAFLQMSTLSTGLFKKLFRYRKLGISVMGNKSLSKTFPATRFAMVLDKDYYFSQSTEDMSAAGLKGGVGDVSINGTATRIFVNGVVTFGGLTVFDEGAEFFTNPQMNNHLKSLPQSVIKIDKIGAGIADQNYTPIILSNFTQEAMDYKKNVIKRFFEISKKIDSLDNKKDLLNVNFFLHLSRYKEDDLRHAIAFVRNEYESAAIDWRTGGRIEASNRLLFDVVVDNQEEFAMKDGSNLRIGYTSLNPPDQKILPIGEWQEELVRKFKSDINLFDENDNTPENIQLLNDIKQSITDWLMNDGRDVFEYFAAGKASIDSKLNNLIYKTIMGWSLIEHPQAHRIMQNVKDFVRIHLMKCKYGITKDEYDYNIHYTKFEKLDDGLIETQYLLHEKAEAEMLEKAKKELKEEDEKDNADDYISQMQNKNNEEDDDISDFIK